jgi:hypothetical protein
LNSQPFEIAIRELERIPVVQGNVTKNPQHFVNGNGTIDCRTTAQAQATPQPNPSAINA